MISREQQCIKQICWLWVYTKRKIDSNLIMLKAKNSNKTKHTLAPKLTNF